jgi:hypothetical protein
MTEDRARAVGNAILSVAVAGAGYYVLRTPPLRRAACRLAITALTVSLPAWFGREVRTAWRASAVGP